jgi:SAM-dependent methyltransferase
MIIDPMIPTPLCEIMGRNGSDKGSINIVDSWHNYTTFYYAIFKHLTNMNLRIFELGLGTNNVNLASNMGANGRPGASLYGWAEFFPNSYIFGADIDKDILFNTSQIKTFYCDQTNEEIIKNMWNENELQENFDIIIEDGLHTFDANVCFFENSIHKLKPNGYYIIEDIMNKDTNLYLNKIKEWRSHYNDCTFTLIEIPSSINTCDNTLLVVTKNVLDFMQSIEKINNKYNTEFTNKLFENKQIFYEIYKACNYTFCKGCESYLFDGQTYEYCDLMYEKQEILFNSVKNSKNVLEIGTYMGHSLLIMLLSNPELKISVSGLLSSVNSLEATKLFSVFSFFLNIFFL